MENKDIKAFDRSIEQMMNEASVTPPFGAWNRIASDLSSAGPAPVAQASSLPKGVWMGFFAGAVFIGSIVSGYLWLNKGKEVHTAAQVASAVPQVKKTVISVVPAVPLNVSEAATQAAVPNVLRKARVQQSAPVVEANVGIAEDPQSVLPQSVEQIREPVTAQVANTPEPVNTLTEEPAKVYDEALVQQAYTLFATPAPPKAEAEADSEKKIRSSSSGGREVRLKFKKPRKSRFNYGRLNRIN